MKQLGQISSKKRKVILWHVLTKPRKNPWSATAYLIISYNTQSKQKNVKSLQNLDWFHALASVNETFFFSLYKSIDAVRVYLCDNHAHYYYYLSLLYNARVSVHCTTIAILDKSTRSTSEQKQALVTRLVRRNNPSKCKYYYRASDSDDIKRVDDVNLYKVINCWMSFGLK